MSTTQAESRAAMLLDERQIITDKWEALNTGILERDNQPTAEEQGQITMYRERVAAIDAETESIADDVTRNREAVKNATRIRQLMAGQDGGVSEQDGELVYDTFAAYARDAILVRSQSSEECAKIAAALGDNEEILKARERQQLLKARVTNTLSSNVGGLIPPQHIAQIFQIIDASRPLVATATKADLIRGTITYPKVTTRPIVAVQNTQKTEAGDQGMVVDMITATASVYLGGGDLSWQAINWSTPSALDLWFQLCAADYALKTEQDAAAVVTHSAESHGITTRLGATPAFSDIMTAIGAGAAAVYAASQRMANTVYMAPDRYWYLFGTTSTPTAIFTTVTGEAVGPLAFVPSRGLDSGTIIVGDRAGLLVAETAGAPVELRVLEPAIGGLEVGIIGGFEAAIVDEGAFSLITSAS